MERGVVKGGASDGVVQVSRPKAPLALWGAAVDQAVTSPKAGEAASGGGAPRGPVGSGPSPSPTGPGPDEGATAEDSLPPLTTDSLSVPPEGGGAVVTSRVGGLLASWRLDVLREGVVGPSVAPTVMGKALVIKLLVVRAVVGMGAVAMVAGFGVRGLVVGGAEVGSLNWGRKSK